MRKTLLATLALAAVVSACSATPSESIATETDEAPLAVLVERPLLVVLLKPSNGNALDHDAAYYADMLFDRSSSVRDFYMKMSNGWLTWKNAGVYTVTDDISPDNGDLHREVRLARQRAAQAGFDFARYDKNGDGTVSEDELTVLVVDEHGATTGDVGCQSLSGKQVCGRGTIAYAGAPFSLFAHELAHHLSPVAHDIYGAAGRCRNYQMSLMSCTMKTTYRGDRASYVDAAHRYVYGWTMRSAAGNGRQTTTRLLNSYFNRKGRPASSVSDILRINGPYGQALFIEVRDGGERDWVSTEGVLAWYVKFDSATFMAEIPTTAPNAPNGATDGADFLLPPTSSCNLDPTSDTRGSADPLQPGKGYRFVFPSANGAIDRNDPQTPELYIKVTSENGDYRITWGENHGNVDGCTIK